MQQTNLPILNVYHDYVHVLGLDLDLNNIKEYCIALELQINAFFDANPNDAKYINNNGSPAPHTTQIFNKYNFLTAPIPSVHKLYKQIQQAFRQVSNTVEEPFFIQCWLNVYKENMGLDWHQHWEPEWQSWHGYVCIDAEPSATVYKLPHIHEEVPVTNVNSSIVIGKSNGDIHKTCIWQDSQHPRITVAFDILPAEKLKAERINHWIPI
jgi:hypothetical protein